MAKLIPIDTKKQILAMIENGKSLNFISKETGVNKTTIYYHYRKIQGKKIKSVKINTQDLEMLGEFLGIFAGDGYANISKNYNYTIRLFFNIREEAYVQSLEKILTKFFGKRPMKYYRKKDNLTTLRYDSRCIYDLISRYISWKRGGKGSKSRTIKLIKTEKYDKFKIGFLRGCLDSDGYISKNKIEFATASGDLAATVCEFVKALEFDFSYTIRIDKRPNRAPMHMIYVYKNERERFLKLIKPRNFECAGRDAQPRWMCLHQQYV